MDEGNFPKQAAPVEAQLPEDQAGASPSEAAAPPEEVKEAPIAVQPPEAEEVKAALREVRAAAMRGTPPEGAPDLTEAPDERAWFVVHCYSGYENKVKHNLQQRIESMEMSNQIFQVVVPTEEEIEV